MRHLIRCVVGIVPAVLVFGTSIPAVAKDQYTILTQGQVAHDGEQPRKPGTGWLALEYDKKKKRWALVPATVRSQYARNSVDDCEKCSKVTGVLITSSKPKAVMLLRSPLLKSGVVPTLIGREIEFASDIHVRANEPSFLTHEGLNYLGRNYKFEFRNAPQQTLSVHVDGQKVNLPLADRDIEEVYAEWVGDLNDDGVLDFVFNEDRYNNGAKCWYLSRKTGNKIDYVPQGCERRTGC